MEVKARSNRAKWYLAALLGAASLGIGGFVASGARKALILRLAALLSAIFAASCDYPHDNEGTLERVRGAILHVGLSERPPWVILQNGEPAGIEPRLIKAFADSLGARVSWTWGTESSLAAALKERQLDIMIGGHSASSPWATETAVTQPYLETSIIIAAPKALLGRNEGSLIVYPASRPDFAALIARNGFKPLPSNILGDGPVAIYDFEASALGLTPTGTGLVKRKLVVLAAPGESRFLYELDRFIGSRSRSEILGPERAS